MIFQLKNKKTFFRYHNSKKQDKEFFPPRGVNVGSTNVLTGVTKKHKTVNLPTE